MLTKVAKPRGDHPKKGGKRGWGAHSSRWVLHSVTSLKPRCRLPLSAFLSITRIN